MNSLREVWLICHEGFFFLGVLKFSNKFVAYQVTESL